MTFSYPINWNLGYLGPFFHLVNVLSQTVTGWFMCSLRLLLAGAHCDSLLLIPPSIGIWRSTKVGSHPPSCPPLSIQHLRSRAASAVYSFSIYRLSNRRAVSLRQVTHPDALSWETPAAFTELHATNLKLPNSPLFQFPRKKNIGQQNNTFSE